MILAIDTSTAACTAALFDSDGACVARRDEIIGLIAGMPLLLLGLALLVAGVSVLVDVSIAIMRVRSSPSLQAEVTSLISAALCCERIVALRHSR